MSAKDIIVKPISAKDGNGLCKRLHYSAKVVPNSQLHFGVFYKNKCEGVMQFGPSLKKKSIINLVTGTQWNGFIELNRMAFSDSLPRFSESRAIGVAHRIIKKNYPHLKWIISFADACQCGDGAIYRASGFLLTQIKKNTSIKRHIITGKISQGMAIYHAKLSKEEAKLYRPIAGYQLRYIYFLDKEYKNKLTAPVIPFSKIKEMGISMYKGIKRVEHEVNAPIDQIGEGGSTPTDTLQKNNPN